MCPPTDLLSSDERARLERAGTDGWVHPMLAVLTDEPFSDPDWVYERKLDGVRLLAFAHSGSVRLLTRNRKERNDHFPEIADALESWAAETDFIVDGEVVCFSGTRTSFSRLQQRIGISDPEQARASGIRIYYYVFDLLNLGGIDVRPVPLRRRKSLLRKAFSFDDPLRFSQHRNESGEAYFGEACSKGWEGLIAKDAAGAYLSKRSRKWLKFKCVNRQELVVTGFTDPSGAREGFGALLVGFYHDGKLVDAGRVGTGYSDAQLRQLRDRLDQLETPESAVEIDRPSDDSIHWVRPELVAEVGFTEWTRDHKLRHPRFIGLRDDKDPTDVVRESPD